MKNILTVIGMAVLGVMVVYLGFAFSQWNINPAKWSQDARSVASIIAVLFALVSLFAKLSSVLSKSK